MAAGAADFPFSIPREGGGIVAELEMRSPGADWAVTGREAAIAVLRTDDGTPHHIVLYGGETLTPYRVFLGWFGPGKHTLSVLRDEVHSAAGAGLEIANVRMSGYAATDPVASAPILYARKNTVGRFSDVPTIVYCERLKSAQGEYLQYSAIYSNEDGGTTSRGLMARWGRTTDIEYMYRVFLDADGKPGPAIIQGPNHVDTQWAGPMESLHPLLMPVTNNNTFGPSDGTSPLRFQIAPILADLRSASRESVMDQYPVTWTVMAKELIREAKLRPFGTVDGEKISDPRNYLYIDYQTANESSATAVLIRLKGGRQFAGDLGQLTFGIDRTGWVRTAVELPPGTRRNQIEAIGFQCRAKRPESMGTCEVRALSGAFFLNTEGRPEEPILRSVPPAVVKSGETFWHSL